MNKGFSTTTTILIIGVVASLAISTSVLLTAGTIDNSLLTREGKQAQRYAESCANFAIRAIQQGESVPASGTFTYGNCSISTAGTGPIVITVAGTSGEATRRLQVEVLDANNPAVVNEWRWQ